MYPFQTNLAEILKAEYISKLYLPVNLHKHQLYL